MLSSLPLELRLDIASYLDPPSCFNLAVTSRESWVNYNTLVKEHSYLLSLNKTYQAVIGKNTEIAKKLLEIVDCPRKGWYIQECIFTNYEGPDDSDLYNVVSAEDTVCSDEELLMLDKITNGISSLYKGIKIPMSTKWPKPSELGWFRRSPSPSLLQSTGPVGFDEVGFDEEPIPVLLHYLPFLQMLGLHQDYNYGGPVNCLSLDRMRLISSAYDDERFPPESRSKLPFQHLTTVAITLGLGGIDWCHVFLSIPSLRNFFTEEMETRQSSQFSYAEATKSNVRDLIFTGSDINITELADVLRRPYNLKGLSYESEIECGVNPRFLKAVLEVLSWHSAHSLEHLALECHDLSVDVCSWEEEDFKVISLRSFQALKSLRLDWRALYAVMPCSHFADDYYDDDEEAEYATEEDIHRLLPASLESIHLSGSFTDEQWITVDRALRQPSPLTPKLKNITMRHSWETEEDVLECEGGVPFLREGLPRWWFDQNRKHRD